MSFSRASGYGYEISSQYATWESKAGDSYRFIIDRDRGDGSEHVEGRAVMPLPLGSGDGKAVFTTPGHEEFLLPAETLMPTEPTLRLTPEAKAGKRVFRASVFDVTPVPAPPRSTAGRGTPTRGA